MKLKNLHWLMLLALWLPATSNAQFDEFGVFLGTSTYAGDLTQRVIEPLEMNFAAGFYIRKKLHKRLGLKIYGYRGIISGNDAHSTVESRLWVRNLRFEAELYEVGGLLEYPLFTFESDHYQGSPYLFLGLSVFHFNPRADVDGKTYELQRLQTEGVEYSLFQPAIPFGAGMKLNISDNGTLGLEVGFRKTFTDYLDDVSGSYPDFAKKGVVDGQRSLWEKLSYRTPEVLPDAPGMPQAGAQRGNPDNNDWFMFFGISLGIYLKN